MVDVELVFWADTVLAEAELTIFADAELTLLAEAELTIFVDTELTLLAEAELTIFVDAELALKWILVENFGVQGVLA